MEPTEIEMVVFTAEDRCDVKCPAQALAVARKDDLELMFCWHHKVENFDALMDLGWEIIEDYETYASYGVKTG